MKILQFAEHCRPIEGEKTIRMTFGATPYWRNRELLKKGHEAVYVCGGEPHEKKEEIVSGLLVKRYPIFFRIGGHAFYSPKIEEDCDLVMADYYGLGSPYVALIYAKTHKKKFVFYPGFHPPDVAVHKRVRSLYDFFIGRNLFTQADHLIASTKKEKTAFEQICELKQNICGAPGVALRCFQKGI